MEELRDGVRELKSSLSDIYNALTSKTAQKSLLYTILFTSASAVLYGFAAVSYLVFYHNYLPDQITTVPVYLQYGYGVNPYGVATIRNIKDVQAYDISVSLTLPRSPPNLERGNFMVALQLLGNPSPSSSSFRAPPPPPPVPDAAENSQAKMSPDLLRTALLADRPVLYFAARPALMPYADPLVSLASRVVFLVYHVLFPHDAESTTLVVDVAERLAFSKGGPVPTTLLVELQAGQDLQVYKAQVTLTAQLAGLRYFMYKYWVTAFLLFTALFWVCEVVFMVLSFTAIASIFGGGDSQGKVPGKSGAGGRADGEGLDLMSDTERTFPTSSKQQPLKYESQMGIVKSESDEATEVTAADLPPVGRGAEADDEDDYKEEAKYDDEADFRDSGIGTSYSDHTSQSAPRRRNSRRGS
ncbi:putative adipose-regulatory protein-domain-containing protein [Podospora didyma]|uniref:Adipose-regulatory protein-domain-containing protein n=1 Tax=Podospora didyma TaxID=330526 RepID=A0AAE0TVX9_9PEZI|nr:putative adipose-regulatory protein-domain-containing protein [Podospora didyma]